MDEPEITWWAAIFTYMGYGILTVFGIIRDTYSTYCTKKFSTRKGYAPLLSDYEDFYARRLYRRIHDCWNRPISSCPGAEIDVMEREHTANGVDLELTGTTRRCLNLGSYNYLGFGDPDSPTKPQVMAALERYGCSTSSSRIDTGSTRCHRELEQLVARFIGKPDAMIFGMGFGTNSLGLSVLVGKGDLLISDAFNHSSIVVGARSSGAKIKVFKHNDPKDLERVLRKAIIEGQPRTHRPWRKVLIVVEGIYSMEGEICPLAEMVAVKKKYNAYLYVDEAHSIGAIGATGRGVTEYCGVDPSDVDVFMGTFTKSFGAVGGYICADQNVIDFLRCHSPGSVYSAGISPPACQQVIAAMTIIMSEDGTTLGQRKIKSLAENSDYFRHELVKMGCHVLGDYGSPVVPVMLYNPAKIVAFSRECYDRNLAVVVVGFPASPLLLGRTRFCISAAHTREQLEAALVKIKEVVDLCGVDYGHANLKERLAMEAKQRTALMEKDKSA